MLSIACVVFLGTMPKCVVDTIKLQGLKNLVSDFE